MDQLKQSFDIDDTYTKLYRRPTHPDQMTKVKDQIPLVSDYNYMADILHLPTDKFGFSKVIFGILVLFLPGEGTKDYHSRYDRPKNGPFF